MSGKRPFILTIGGFDPSGGAGVLADIKTFEQNKTLGMAVNTANTIQHESEFKAVNWLDESLILGQLDLLLEKYCFTYVKIGLIPNIALIETIYERMRNMKTRIIWDPVLKASAGFDMQHNMEEINAALKYVYFVTPNWCEIQQITGVNNSLKAAGELAKQCNVYLKGGHNSEDPGRDHLFIGDNYYSLKPKGNRIKEKHGSGCILASALAANLSLGYPVLKSCMRAKEYTAQTLESNASLLAYHKR